MVPEYSKNNVDSINMYRLLKTFLGLVNFDNKILRHPLEIYRLEQLILYLDRTLAVPRTNTGFLGFTFYSKILWVSLTCWALC